MKNGPIVLVGGGTGGHIFPLVAVAEELQVRKQPFVYIGSADGPEAGIIAGHGWEFEAIAAGKWRRYRTVASILQNVADVFRTVKGFFQAVRLLRRLDAQLVVSKGGYVAVPVLYAARLIGCPVIVHESDAVMGLANKIGSKFAQKVLTAFDPAVLDGDGRFVKVGIPVRRALIQAARLRSPKKDRPVLLILPGSQGSMAINRYVKEGMAEFLGKYDIIHLTGEPDYQVFAEIKRALPKNLAARYKPYPFIERELPYYYQAADLIIARSSATTMAEAALFKKPLYVVPLPQSANNHQQRNAQLLEASGAVMVRQQYQLSTEQLLTDIESLLSNPERLLAMGESLGRYFDSATATGRMIGEISNVAAQK
ncbi:MAG: UDP-N-acetylglucosamine--N-acetylmuramyl-(pentapeptide) pyrophosphoryl-undecaprenol N-acetylglucosamine transferase [Patescibacteria group bacterium]